MILDNPELQLHNPWWESKHLILEDKKLLELEKLKFKYFHPVIKNFPATKDVIFTLRGPRRIGKTTLIKIIIKKLLLTEKRISRENVFYYPCDLVQNYKELYYILKEYLTITDAASTGRRFIFLDEISFVSEWQRAIKSLVDSFLTQNATILITGSSIIDLSVSSERLPGRRGLVFSPDINFYPLSFNEYILLTDPQLADDLVRTPMRKLAKADLALMNYLISGGFPQTINEYLANGFVSSTTYEIIINWIEGDLHKAGKSSRVAQEIIRNIEKHQSTPVSFYQLAKESGVASHATVQEYLETLERMFTIVICPYYSIDQKRSDSRKNKKIYFTDPFIRASLICQSKGFLSEAFDYSRKVVFSGKNMPAIAEELTANRVRRHSDSLWYGKFKKYEIDFVSMRKNTLNFLEVKYQNKIDREAYWYELANMQVITKSTMTTRGEIKEIPLSIYLCQS